MFSVEMSVMRVAYLATRSLESGCVFSVEMPVMRVAYLVMRSLESGCVMCLVLRCL